MARLVATINVGNLWYGKHTLPSIRAYAHRVGADFLEITQFPRAGDYGNGVDLGHPWFLQIDYLKAFAQQGAYRNLMLIDLDTMVHPDCEDLFDLVGDGLGMALDMGMPQVHRNNPLWPRYESNLFGREPAIGANYYNSGLIVGSLRAIRAAVPNLRPPFGASSQDAINISWRGLPITTIPERFNWMAPQFHDASKGQSIVHFGAHEDLIPGFSFDNESCHPTIIKSRDDLGHYFNRNGLMGEGVEVGVLTGEFSACLLKTWEGRLLHCVDSWSDQTANENYKDGNNVPEDQHEKNYLKTIQNLSQYASRYKLHRAMSVDAAKSFRDGSLDFVYIDAGHYYDAVMEDLNSWVPKIRQGGIICGHDYLDGVIRIGSVDSHFEVKRAVDQWAKQHGLEVLHSGEELWKSWIIHL